MNVDPHHRIRRHGSANGPIVMILAAVALLGTLGYFLLRMDDPRATAVRTAASNGDGENANAAPKELFFYCAAGIRRPLEKIVQDYQNEFRTVVTLQYGGSNTLLSQLEVAKTGDVYLAADFSYIDLARERGLVKEAIPLAWQHPAVAVAKGNPKNIKSIDDLLRDDVVTAVGNPDQAAVGKVARKLLTASGHWDAFEQHVTKTGVFKPTVPEVANDVKIGSVDAGIVWDSTVRQYDELDLVDLPELVAGRSNITIGILTSAEAPSQALHFARYVGARDKGLKVFESMGYEIVDGDLWADVPEITFFCGSVNRRAVEKVLLDFQSREGVVINTKYNGCGILTAEMKTMSTTKSLFPDTYMACDVYYLDVVREMFQEAVNVSDTEIVIAVPKGNPGGITGLKDLTRDGVRIAIGQPDQCTIGVLTKRLLKKEGVYDAIIANGPVQTATSALLITPVATGTLDAALAYKTDTLAESEKIDTIEIDSAEKLAIQPFSIARSSDNKYLSRRLFAAISGSRDAFEQAGFHWRLDETSQASVPEPQPDGE